MLSACTVVPENLKETKIEEAIGFFVTFLSLAAFQLKGPSPQGPLWLHLWTFCSAKAQRAAAE